MSLKRWGVLLGLGYVGYSLFLEKGKKYTFSIPRVFIPRIPGEREITREDFIKLLKGRINIDFTTEPRWGWRLSLRPIHGIPLPGSIDLPLTAPLSALTLKSEIEKKLEVERVSVAGVTVGYWAEAKDITFYA